MQDKLGPWPTRCLRGLHQGSFTPARKQDSRQSPPASKKLQFKREFWASFQKLQFKRAQWTMAEDFWCLGGGDRNMKRSGRTQQKNSPKTQKGENETLLASKFLPFLQVSQTP